MHISNKKAVFDYIIQEKIEAGIALTGAEVKSLRGGHGKLDGSYVKIIGSEAYLISAYIYPYEFARQPQGGAVYDPKRTRKLLLHKRELIRLKSKLDSANLTLIPLSWYSKGPHIKLEIALGRGKKQYEKREHIKRQDIKRELERQFRGKIK